MAVSSQNSNNNKFAIVTSATSQSEYTISLPSGYTILNCVIVSAMYKTGSRGFMAASTNDSSYPMPYFHSSHGIVVNSSSVDTSYTLYIVLMLIS